MYFAFTVYISGTGIVHGRIQFKEEPIHIWMYIRAQICQI